MTIEQKLMLFLISCDPGIRDIYTMVKLYDNADFPSNTHENLKHLLNNELIFVVQNFDNGTASRYEITKKGELYLERDFDADKIICYIKTMENYQQLLFITKTYIDKKTAYNN